MMALLLAGCTSLTWTQSVYPENLDHPMNADTAELLGFGFTVLVFAIFALIGMRLARGPKMVRLPPSPPPFPESELIAEAIQNGGYTKAEARRRRRAGLL